MNITEFAYKPLEYEAEKASNSYIMSLIAAIGGLPLPVINLIATLIFYLANRKATYFVRWHCTQALLSQSSMLIINTIGVVWSLMILFGDKVTSNEYIAYAITALLFNISEFIATIYAAVRTGRGQHVEFWFFGKLTHLLCKDRS